jgi:hypothetical protein
MNYLSNLNLVKQYSTISNNLDEKFINPARREAQEVSYQEIVGTKLYNKLCDLVGSGAYAYPANIHYKELLKLSQFFLIYKTMANLTISATFKLNNIGLNTAYDDNVSIPTVKDIFLIKKYWDDKANDEIGKITSYLKENRSEFPELGSNKCWDVKPTLNDKSNSSMWLGGTRHF